MSNDNNYNLLAYYYLPKKIIVCTRRRGSRPDGARYNINMELMITTEGS